jgi:hypothetical protein
MVMSYLVEAVKGCSDRDVSGKNGCMRCDDKFVGGGLIPVGNREVEASHPMLQDLGIECRSVQDTIRDAVYSMCVPDSVTVTDIK